MAKGKKARRAEKLAQREAAPVVTLNLPPPWAKISDTVLSRSLRNAGMVPVAFEMPKAPPRVIPKDTPQTELLANDEMIIEANAWAAEQVYSGAFFNGVTWLGYTYLSELAQRPEYRRVCELLATECTRKWIKLQSTSTDEESKAERIKELAAELNRLDVQGAFRKMIELDGFFGRAHLYLDTGSTEDRVELVTDMGDGSNAVTLNKFKGRTGFLKAVKPIEPVWCYPAKYNATDPLKPDWYNPQSWFCQGKEVHSSRLLCFVGREVPDLLKPSYSFGGLSLSQMGKPYVDNWLRTRQSIGNLVWSFSLRGLKTNMGSIMGADGDQLFKRAALLANLQTNQDITLIDKDTEEFFNITTPLATLDALQAQAQEHMASVWGTPIIKLLGIQPAGLNASSEGELTAWNDWVEAFQEKFMTRRLGQVMNWIMLSLWGEVDPEITFSYESLRALSELELAEKRKFEADTDVELIEAGVLAPIDVRKRLASDPDSPYDGLDVDDVPDDVFGEEGEGDPPDLGSIVGQLGATTPRDDRDRTRDPAGEADRREPGAGAVKRAERIRGRAPDADGSPRAARVTERA